MNEIHVQQMIAHCVGSAPEAACGIITVGGIIPCENVSHDPLVCCEINAELVERIPDSVLRGFFHSHVNESAIPTDRDLRAANCFGYIYCILGVREDAAREFHLYRLDGTESEKIFTRIILGEVWDKTR